MPLRAAFRGGQGLACDGPGAGVPEHFESAVHIRVVGLCGAVRERRVLDDGHRPRFVLDQDVGAAEGRGHDEKPRGGDVHDAVVELVEDDPGRVVAV